MGSVARAVLVIADGYSLVGKGFGACGTAFGEAVFVTGQTSVSRLLRRKAPPKFCNAMVYLRG